MIFGLVVSLPIDEVEHLPRGLLAAKVIHHGKAFRFPLPKERRVGEELTFAWNGRHKHLTLLDASGI